VKLALYNKSLSEKMLRCSANKKIGIESFINGVKRHGVTVIETNEPHYYPSSDFGFMFSFADIHQSEIPLLPYMQARKNIYEESNKNLFFFENDVLKGFNNELIMRFPFKSVYDHEAEYFLEQIPDDLRKDSFKHITPTPHSETKKVKHIICLNRLSGYGRCGVYQFKWAYNLIKRLKSKFPNTNIEIRVHPGNIRDNSVRGGRPRLKHFQFQNDVMYHECILNTFPEVKITLPDKRRYRYLDTLDRQATHIFNTSSASCECMISGCSTAITHKAAFAYNFAPHKVVSRYKLQGGQDTDGLLKKYRKTHFTVDEVNNGTYWDYIKEGVKNYL
jgi:hypothetical protein